MQSDSRSTGPDGNVGTYPIPFQTLKELWQCRLLWERRQARWRFLLVDCWRIAAKRRGKLLFSVIASFVVFPCIYACSHAASLLFCAKIALGSASRLLCLPFMLARFAKNVLQCFRACLDAN